MARFYETTCIDLPGSGGALSIMSVPQRPDLASAWQTGDQRLASANRIAGSFGFDRGDYRGVDHRDITADLLVPAILYTRPDRAASYSGQLHAKEPGFRPEEFVLNNLSHFAQFVLSADESLYLFAARVAHEPLVPVEQSAARAVSLAKIAGAAGADMTLVMAGAHDPVLLISTPFAVIVMGAASGVASGLFRGLQEGVYRNVVRWMTGTDPQAEAGSESHDAAP